MRISGWECRRCITLALNGADIFGVQGKWVYSGLVDTHVHPAPGRRALFFSMLARAGSMLRHGLSLVRFKAWTLLDFVQKCCWAAARMPGLPKKGHLFPGADGDLVVADPCSQEALLTLARGKITMVNGMVMDSGGTIVNTGRGLRAIAKRGVSAKAVDLETSLFYRTLEGP
jgi:dihydroorotase-like cyclic amidohydrolase